MKCELVEVYINILLVSSYQARMPGHSHPQPTTLVNCLPKSIAGPHCPLSDLLPTHSVPEENKQSTTLRT